MEKDLGSVPRTDKLIPASRLSLHREADACVSTRLTGANQAPIVACGVSRSFRMHHIDAVRAQIM